MFYERGAGTTILLGMHDVTERRASEREKDELLRQKDILFEELQHRVANSLRFDDRGPRRRRGVIIAAIPRCGGTYRCAAY